jgi:hypothetical protein
MEHTKTHGTAIQNINGTDTPIVVARSSYSPLKPFAVSIVACRTDNQIIKQVSTNT